MTKSIERIIEENEVASSLSQAMAGVKVRCESMGSIVANVWNDCNAYADLYRAGIGARVMLSLLDYDMEQLQKKREELVQAIAQFEALHMAPPADL